MLKIQFLKSLARRLLKSTALKGNSQIHRGIYAKRRAYWEVRHSGELQRLLLQGADRPSPDPAGHHRPDALQARGLSVPPRSDVHTVLLEEDEGRSQQAADTESQCPGSDTGWERIRRLSRDPGADQPCAGEGEAGANHQ